MADINVQKGTGAITYQAATASDKVVTPGPNVTLLVKNTSGGAVTVTAVATKQCDQGSLHNLVSVVANATDGRIGPIDNRYSDAADGKATVTFSAFGAGVQIAAVAQ